MTAQRARQAIARLTVIIAVVAAGLAAQPAPAQNAQVLIVAGDSIAAGIGSSLPRTRGYAALVTRWIQDADETAIVLENVAVPGETANSFATGDQLDRALDAIATATSAGIPIRAIALSLGGNEMLQLRPMGLADRQAGLDRFRADYAAALGAVRDAVGTGVPIVVTTYYELTQGDVQATYTDAWWVSQFNAAIRDAATGAGAVVADVERAFDGSIPIYTHYPFDVHPNNAGHAEIARVVAAALGVRDGGPVIEIVTAEPISRSTPTLRARISSATGIASVSFTSDGVPISGPFDLGGGEYVALLDFGNTSMNSATVSITAIDVLGQEASTVATLVRAEAQEGAP